MNPDIIGWTASVFLVLTLSAQALSQWRQGHSDGLSPWLFIGMFAAGVTFAVYSVLVENTVFIVTNTLSATAAATGFAIMCHHRKQKRTANNE